MMSYEFECIFIYMLFDFIWFEYDLLWCYLNSSAFNMFFELKLNFYEIKCCFYISLYVLSVRLWEFLNMSIKHEEKLALNWWSTSGFAADQPAVFCHL
jgi:hypothetical protein